MNILKKLINKYKNFNENFREFEIEEKGLGSSNEGDRGDYNGM
jgi:hypothetical protein